MLAGGKLAILILGFSKGARTQATLWGRRRLPTDYFYSTGRPLLRDARAPSPFPRLLPRQLSSAPSNLRSPPISQPHFAPHQSPMSSAGDRSSATATAPRTPMSCSSTAPALVQAQFQGEPTDAELPGPQTPRRTAPHRRPIAEHPTSSPLLSWTEAHPRSAQKEPPMAEAVQTLRKTALNATHRSHKAKTGQTSAAGTCPSEYSGLYRGAHGRPLSAVKPLRRLAHGRHPAPQVPAPSPPSTSSV